MGPVDSELDVENLQGDLDTIYNWQDTNNMQFNGKKFEMLRYGPNTDLKNSTNYLTPEYEDIIEVKENLRDLGVIISMMQPLQTIFIMFAKKLNRRQAGYSELS